MNSGLNRYKLSQITNILVGGDMPENFSENKTDSFSIPIYSNGEKNNGLYGYTDLPKINEPSVTISARGSKVGFAAIRNEPYFPIVRLISLIPIQNKLDVKYLFYNLKLNRLTGTGSGQPQITIPDISNKTIDIPSFQIQQKIAAVLFAVDAKIQHNNSINSELELMAKTLYDYWFVQFDFPNKDGKPYKTFGGKMVWSEELKREIPEGWDVKKVKYIANTGSGSTPLKSKKEYYTNGNIPWINSGEVNNPFIIEAKKFITQLGLEESSTKLSKRGTLLMAMYGATAGKVSILDIEACTNQAICTINVHLDLHNNYLKFVLEDLYEFLINLSSGSARDNLSQDRIKDLDILVPEVEIVKDFDAVISPVYDKVLNLYRENHKLAGLRDWLLPMLMNGQVKVD